MDVLGGDWLAEVQDVTESAEERDAGLGTARETGVGARQSLFFAKTIDALGSPGFCPVEAGEGGGGGGARAFLVGLYVNGRADRERAAEGAGDAAADGTLLVGVRAVAGPTNETGRIPTGDDLESGRLEAPRGGGGSAGGARRRESAPSSHGATRRDTPSANAGCTSAASMDASTHASLERSSRILARRARHRRGARNGRPASAMPLRGP